MIHNQHGSFLFMKITQECTVNIISCIQLEVELKSGFVLSGKYFASFFKSSLASICCYLYILDAPLI